MANISLTITGEYASDYDPAGVIFIPAKIRERPKTFKQPLSVHDVILVGIDSEVKDNVKCVLEWSIKNNLPLAYDVSGDGLDLMGQATVAEGLIQETVDGLQFALTVTPSAS